MGKLRLYALVQVLEWPWKECAEALLQKSHKDLVLIIYLSIDTLMSRSTGPISKLTGSLFGSLTPKTSRSASQTWATTER
jgi:hypothetical protein